MNKSHPIDKTTRLSPQRPGRSASKPALATRRLWIYRLLTIILIPTFILGALELVLSVSNYGYPTSYFRKSRIAGQDFLITNPKFGYRFFPSAITREPIIDQIPAQKAADVYRIIVFGESAALGDPDHTYGISRYLDVLLEERYPNVEFEIICVAMTAINSHAILPIARECARLDSDLWLIYMGNNEMVGPFGASTIFGARSPGLGFVRTSLALKKTCLGQLVASFTSKLGSASQKMPDKWKGIDMFKENLLRHNDPKRLKAYDNFEGNLKDILEAGRQVEVPIILSTIGSNLKDCSPFASLHRENLDASKRSEWDVLFLEGLALEKAGQYDKALSRYKDAATIDSEFAELQFRMGTCQLALGHTEQARKSFISARDYDALAVRADTRINQILRDSVPEGDDQVVTLDAAEALSLQSPAGISGEELFCEHVHLTTTGNFTLARIIAEQTEAFLPPEIIASQTKDWPDLETCNRHLALTAWDQMRLWRILFQRIDIPPHTSQSSNPRNKYYINLKINRLRSQNTIETMTEDRQLYEAAVKRMPNDAKLAYNYSQFLCENGDINKAIEQAERMCDLFPNVALTYYNLAKTLAKANRHREAVEKLEAALEIRSGDYPIARRALDGIKLENNLNGVSSF